MTRVSICCGVGGTGKTTTSAALAVASALAGDRVCVLTIDPARRLADALGVGPLGNVPTRVALEAPGALDAAMLDRKGTWDEVISRHATPELATRLFANPYYRAVSQRLSGSQEYMAVEKLHALATDGAWDHLVIDTPPATHVLDFFRAPERVGGILDQSMLRLLVEPGSGLRGAATRGALALVERLAGDRVMGDIREFFTLIGELSPGFRERSAAVAELLRSARTTYWLVTDAEAPERNDLLGFLGEVRGRGMAFGGFLVNRVQPELAGPFPDPEAVREAAGPDAAFALALPEEELSRVRAHRRAARQLTQAARAPAWLVPELPGGVRSLEGLRALAAHLPPSSPDVADAG